MGGPEHMSTGLPDTWVADRTRTHPAPPVDSVTVIPDHRDRAVPAPPRTEVSPPASRGPRRRRPTFGPVRAVVAFLANAVIGFALVVLLAMTGPLLFGYRSFTVMSGSMEPSIHVGDVVVDKQVSPLDIRVGDIVTFRSTSNPKVLITHRVRYIEVADGLVRVRTKGDANNTEEHWAIPVDGSLGRAEFHVWRLGYFLVWSRSHLGRLALVVVPALLLGVY